MSLAEKSIKDFETLPEDKKMEVIDIDNVLLFHKKIVEQTGGSEGIRDLGLIESGLTIRNYKVTK